MSKRLAIVGAGISGLVCAHVLGRSHDVTVFEAAATAGGHAHTAAVPHTAGVDHVDTGFVVFNELNYPGFVQLMSQLGVDSQPTDMSFSVQVEQSGLEYQGSSELGKLFAQRRNWLRPSFHRFVRGVLRFNKEAPRLLETPGSELDLGTFLARGGFPPSVRRDYVIPMAAAIWSASEQDVLGMPARFFVEFFENHRFFALKGRPQWRTITGGSSRYVERLVEATSATFELATPIADVTRRPDGVRVRTMAGAEQVFDEVILAVHSDQALGMLGDASPAEREVLGAMRYQPNDVALHGDASVMPRSPRAWASWNAHVPRGPASRATLTYDMGRLQQLPAGRQHFVTLNRTKDLAPELVRQRYDYAHPIFDLPSRAAQGAHRRISGVNRTHYCGAYWGYGFHEDGVQSGLRVCKAFGSTL
jgi:predicted NAD/FAD-binding protein